MASDDVGQRRAAPTGVPRLSLRPSDSAVACQRCHHRKKKCDRARPACGACSRVNAACVYDIAISDRSNPGFVADLLKESATLRERIAEQADRIARLTAQIRDGAAMGQSPSLVTSEAVAEAPPPPSLHTVPPRLAARPAVGGYGPSLAERIVCQVLTTDMGLSLRGAIGQQLGASGDDPEDALSSNAITAWPPKSLAVKLVDLFFEYHIAFYPIYNQDEVAKDMDELYGVTHPGVPTPSTFTVPDYRIFRLFLILALGCNLLETERGTPRTDTATSLCRYALEHFPAVFRVSDLACIAGLVTFTQYCILDFGRTSPYHVVGVVARFAMELGLHRDDSSLPLAEQDARRRVFYTVYNLDRVVAVSLTKQVTIPDSVITAQLPTACATRLQSYLDPAEWFAHAMAMRRLSGIILDEVYLAPRLGDLEERELTLARIHNLVDDWYDGIPRDAAGECVPLFELYYNVLLTNLHRPSPLCTSTQALRMVSLRRTAYRTIELYRAVRAQRGLAENYVHLANIVTVAVTVVYTLLEADGNPRNLALRAWRREAFAQVDVCEQLLANFCINWPGVSRFCSAFNVLANEVRGKLGGQPAPPPAVWPLVAPQQTQVSGFSDTGTSPQFSDQGQWDAWAAPALLTEADMQMALSGIGVDALLASVGLNVFAEVE